MPSKRTPPQKRTTTKLTVESAAVEPALTPQEQSHDPAGCWNQGQPHLGPCSVQNQPDDDGVIDAVIVDDDDPEAVAAEISANLAVPWDERKADLAAMETIAAALAWQAKAQVLLNERNIPALAKHVDAAADLPLGPTRLRRLVPIEIAADIAARYVPAMAGVEEVPPSVEAFPLLNVINGPEEEWPTLGQLIGPVIEPAGGVWGNAG
jgi:hypothetical protein